MTEPGPLAEEAAKLLGAAQDWLHRVVLDEAAAKVSTGAPECCLCPLCQLIVLARGHRPELAERFGEVQAAVAGLLRSLTESAGGTHAGAGDHGAGGSGAFQRIDLSDDGAR